MGKSLRAVMCSAQPGPSLVLAERQAWGPPTAPLDGTRASHPAGGSGVNKKGCPLPGGGGRYTRLQT